MWYLRNEGIRTWCQLTTDETATDHWSALMESLLRMKADLSFIVWWETFWQNGIWLLDLLANERQDWKLWETMKDSWNIREESMRKEFDAVIYVSDVLVLKSNFWPLLLSKQCRLVGGGDLVGGLRSTKFSEKCKLTKSVSEHNKQNRQG